MSILKVNEIQIFNGTTVTITAPAVVAANDNTNAALRITQTGTGNALVVEDSSPESTPFVVDNIGRVLVGTSTKIGSTEKKIEIANGNLGNSFFANNAFASAVLFEKGRGTSAGTIVQNNDELGSLIFRGDDGVDSFSTAAQIVAYVDGTPGTNDMPGRLVFSTTADGANSPTERMRIDSSGNVGIGTTSPLYNLHVEKTSGTIARFSFSTNEANLEINSPETNGTLIKAMSGDYLALGSNAIERMRIDSSGNVGIGTSSPAQKLDVTGNINATGALTLGTALAIAEGGTGVTSLGSLDAADLGSGAATDGYVLTADGAGGAAWEAASGGGGGGTTAYVEHSSTISDSFTVTSGTNRMYIGGTTFSGTISVAGRLAIVAGPANFTGTINVTGTLAIME